MRLLEWSAPLSFEFSFLIKRGQEMILGTISRYMNPICECSWEICQKCWPQKWKSSNWKVAVFQIGFRNCRINSIIELILMLYLNIQTNSFVLTFFLAPALCDQLNGLESLPSTQGTWKAYSAWFTFICKVSVYSNAINYAESVRSFESSNLSKNYLQFSILQMKHIKFILFIFYKKETLL